MIIFNWIGIGICIVGFGIAFAIRALFGVSAEGHLMAIAGPIIVGLDLAYRLKSEKGHWLRPGKGGSLFFLPVWCFGVLWFVLGLIYMASNSSPTESILSDRNKTELDRIAQMYRNGQVDTALLEINTYVDTYPQDDLAWTIKGTLLEKKDRDQEAKDAYEQALALHPENFQATIGLGVMYRKEGDYETAMACYRKALALKPGYAQAYSSMAVIELKRNHDKQALEYAKQGYEEDNEDPVIAANLAIMYHYNGMLEERDTYTEIAEKLGYQNIETLYQIYSGELTVKDE
jgi:Flp pilus assembly protein TadD